MPIQIMYYIVAAPRYYTDFCPMKLCTVVERVMKSKLSHILHNQYYPRVDTKKGY
jgi:hypothetical protein